VEGLEQDGKLHPLQQAFSDHHALQCGFCTPGMLMSSVHLLETNPQPSELEIRKGIQGNLCRCTGYKNIFEAISAAAQKPAGGWLMAYEFTGDFTVATQRDEVFAVLSQTSRFVPVADLRVAYDPRRWCGRGQGQGRCRQGARYRRGRAMLEDAWR
jgi:xanthine dehydrogenase iron-sulfur cluster and FAD-binding subunit A